MSDANPLRTVAAISLFTEDLAASKDFYTRVFEAKVLFEDPESCSVRFNNTIINLLLVSVVDVDKHPLVWPLQIRLAVEDAAETAIDIFESYQVRLVWVFLCVAHFLSFTLGLTAILPCLFIYGAIVSLIYVAARRGSAGLIGKVLSWANL
ncbi:hypothetical protein NQ176_g7280 [Zarea fungicola]|uniref:Uncharacterized protein n=1 Tax=Zarea fungicola TaxID=93591 RepID=A0ACC1N0B0_9HYPO|nr:hypothetical protein NQ176_g7280 [Lecanicillium fungicola]